MGIHKGMGMGPLLFRFIWSTRFSVTSETLALQGFGVEGSWGFRLECSQYIYIYIYIYICYYCFVFAASLVLKGSGV